MLALTITPLFDVSITSAGDAAQVESAIDDAINDIDPLYANSGSVGIVFSQAAGSFLGQSSTADLSINYNLYKAFLTADSSANPSNAILSSAVANLSKGNDASGAQKVTLTTADSRIALGFDVGSCFNSSGAFVSGCGQAYDGAITLSTSYALNYTATPVAGAYSAIAVVEHEINEILGGGGQGSVLGTSSPTTVGVLDLYRYSAPNTPSFTTSGSATSYFSVDGGTTDIVGFNQTSGGDYADFNTNTNIQSAFSNSGIVPSYTPSSPEFLMLESIGYNGVVPEPASLAVLGSGLAGLLAMSRRKRQMQ